MNRDKLTHISRPLTIALGAVCLIFALSTIAWSALNGGFLLVAIFAAVVAPRMTLQLPRSRFAISFSDAAVFLTFLLFGGPAAILIAALESTANCLYLRSKKFPFGPLMIPTNISINTIAITGTYLIWLSLPDSSMFGNVQFGTDQHLTLTLGGLALTQFTIASFLAAFFYWQKSNAGFWRTWSRDVFSSSVTQIVGAGLAGLAYKVISFGEVITALIAFGALGIMYLSYRRSIGEINTAIYHAEAAEREKAETERERRREAETHADELAAMLEKEEKANDALRKSEKDLQHAALFDPLTDLPNRKHFGDLLEKLIADYSDDPRRTFAVMFLDIRKFKNINDSLGHSLGDKVLAIAAKRFVKLLGPKDMVARLGGDEFAIILRDVSTAGKAQKAARRLIESLSQPFSVAGHRISIDINVGIAPCDVEYSTPEEILRDADIAMHHAKERNSGVAVFTRDLRELFLERVRLETDLRNAVDRGELSMAYQPLVSLSDGSLLGFEALLRWQHPEFGAIPPSKFIPVAEESGLIIPITNWILIETCRQLSEWQKIGPSCRDLIVSVNVSGRHLSNEDLIDDVENALALSGITPESLKLEITESAAMDNAEQTISTLNRLKALGVQISIDDFGTGYSSLSYLHRLPFDTLKIDRSFVYNVGESGENSEILQTIISLAQNLKKSVVAEGVETEAQLAVLQRLGCDYGQGYLFARPQPKDAAERLIYEGRSFLPGDQEDAAAIRTPEKVSPIWRPSRFPQRG